VASLAHCDETRAVVDELVTLATPDPFEMVSTWYDDFSAVSDADVMRLLQRTPMTVEAGPQTDAIEEHDVSIPVDDTDGRTIIGDLGVPNDAPTEPRGLVILAHGGGSTRQSYRNRYLAGRLRMAGWSSLRVALLTETQQAEDASTAALRFDVPFIARRLRAATEWVAVNSAPGANRLVLFGASTGAAAAMVTAAERPDLVFAVASRGGRVDLAGDALTRVVSPVLLVVGGADGPTIEWNRVAAQRLPKRPELVIVRDAGHTFEEPGALGEVGERVVRWLDGLDRLATRPRWLRVLSRY
jgi:pimeloyl-ACP methyl ester carboxylesterase